MLPFWLDAAKIVFCMLNEMEVVGDTFAVPPWAYRRETGALDLKVLSWMRLFRSQSLTMPSPRPVARNSLCLLNLIPPLTGTDLL